MIQLYDKEFKTNLGTLNDVLECLVEEERNGVFELALEYPCYSSLADKLQKENIIVCNANDTLKNQKFRIYDTVRLMDNTIVVHAKHISFDLLYDYVDSISIENQSCEYVLNQLFRNSNFSTHYKGYSDIINAQDYNVNMVNIIEAIGGKSESIIDTFGTGAEILRDNENIHVLNKRGYDNDVTIEYKKNLTGFELEEDTSELITRILPYAIYTDDETSNEITVKANYVDSPLIANYSHPYIRHIDYSDRFNNETPTTSKLKELAENEFKNNKVDRPKQNFKLEFIPLSKCVGYEGLEDKISLCDTVTIKDSRYNIDTQAKVIKTVFNVLKNRYESMELGEPKTSLGDIIGGGSDAIVGPQGPQGPQGPPGADGSIGDFPDSLPATPVLTSKLYGFSSIELSWTFEGKVYYQYELYASKTKDFTPNTFDLIHQGQTSSFLFQAKPNETWYFKVCAINSHGSRTEFSNQVAVTTRKIDDMSNYFEEAAISNAVIGTLTSDYMEAGIIKGHYIDAKNLSVTNGNGVRTLDIDSYGNVNIKGYATFSDLSTAGKTTINGSNISSGTITGVTLQTYADSTTNGVRINKNSMGLNGTVFSYPSNSTFRIQSDVGMTQSAVQDIYLMPGMNAGTGTQSGAGYVVIPSATLRTQRLNVVDGSTLDGDLKVSGATTLTKLTVNGNAMFNNGNIYVNRLTSIDGAALWFSYSSGTIYAGRNLNMNGYSITNQSDRKLKENIKYVDDVVLLDSEKKNTLKDVFYNDFKNKFKFATYNYKKEDQKDKTHFGFIAQDLEETLFADYVLVEGKDENDEDVLCYDVLGLVNTYASVLQKEIEIRDNQIEDLTSRIAKLEKIILNSQG